VVKNNTIVKKNKGDTSLKIQEDNLKKLELGRRKLNLFWGKSSFGILTKRRPISTL
jgi:hypothetical protein